MRSRFITVLLTAALMISIVGVFPVGGVSNPVGGTSAAKHGATTNFTITLNDHTPGATNTTMSAYAAGLQADFPVWGNLTILFPSGMTTSTCSLTDARAAGVDTNNDDPGTHTDKTFIGKFKEQKQGTDHTPKYGSYNFYSEDSFAGDSISLRSDDQIVARIAGCWGNPSEAGWYRWNGYVNGTNPQNAFAETNAYSHWYYICDCGSYDEAVNTLGAPPTDAAGALSNDGQPGTVVDRDYRLYAAGGSGGQGATPSATPTASGGGTATPMTTATPSMSGTSTATTPGSGQLTSTAGRQTATAGGGAKPATRQAQTAATANARETNQTGSTPAATGTETGNTNAVVSPTQTSTHQPGFGISAVVMALAILAVGFRADRRV